MTRVEVPVRWCPAHEDVAQLASDQCTAAARSHLAKPCPLTPPLSYETEGEPTR